jgi:hypothetical protein
MRRIDVGWMKKVNDFQGKLNRHYNPDKRKDHRCEK